MKRMATLTRYLFVGCRSPRKWLSGVIFVLLSWISVPVEGKQVQTFLKWNNCYMSNETGQALYRWWSACQDLDWRNTSAQRAALRTEFNAMRAMYQPDYLMIHLRWGDVEPSPNDFRFGLYNFLIRNLVIPAGITPILLMPAFDNYGGQMQTPFSYYGERGWFWQSCKVPYDAQGNCPASERIGLYKPSVDAMHFSSRVSNGFLRSRSELRYVHNAGYNNYAYNFDYVDELSDGRIDTGVSLRFVHEGPRIVYNGYDTALNRNKAPIHTPIPSFSSRNFRREVRELYQAVAQNFRSDVQIYVLGTEPTYGHLRENMNLQGRAWSHKLEVDYNPREQAAYNAWRQRRGMGPRTIPPPPIPAGDNYLLFMKENLADFSAQLKSAIHSKNPGARIVSSWYVTDWIRNKGTGLGEQMQRIQPDWLTMEPSTVVQRVGEFAGLMGNRPFVVQDGCPENQGTASFCAHTQTKPPGGIAAYNHFDRLIIPSIVSKTSNSSSNPIPLWIHPSRNPQYQRIYEPLESSQGKYHRFFSVRAAFLRPIGFRSTYQTGADHRVSVTVRNTGWKTWRSCHDTGGCNGVSTGDTVLGLILYDRNMNRLRDLYWVNLNANIPRGQTVGRGQKLTVAVRVRRLDGFSPGSYRLVLDVLDYGNRWVSGYGNLRYVKGIQIVESVQRSRQR